MLSLPETQILCSASIIIVQCNKSFYRGSTPNIYCLLGLLWRNDRADGLWGRGYGHLTRGDNRTVWFWLLLLGRLGGLCRGTATNVWTIRTQAIPHFRNLKHYSFKRISIVVCVTSKQIHIYSQQQRLKQPHFHRAFFSLSDMMSNRRTSNTLLRHKI